jgi:hypothetical protein
MKFHVIIATIIHATVEELVEGVFSVRPTMAAV